MISTVSVLGAIAAVFIIMHVHLIYRYSKTKVKPNFYFGVTCVLWAVASIFGILIAFATAINSLPLTTLFYRTSTTSGALAYLFLNIFAISMRKSNEKTRGMWISFIPFLVVTSIVWAFNPVVEGVVGGVTEFTLTSMYKAPYGPPLVEIIIASMVLIAIYPIYLFFCIGRTAKERVIEIKSLLMGVGLLTGTIFYSIEVTGAISYHYMSFYRPLIFVGSSIIYLGYMMPKWLERKLARRTIVSEELVRSFVEEFFLYPSVPSKRIQLHAFSETLGLDHQQLVGRKVLLEFDPASHYEKAIQDFAAEATANVEPIVVFTRRGSAIHTSLREQKAVKFFCLTQQVSVPKELSENEILLPTSDTSLMLDVLNKTLKVRPQGAINIVFDSLSDLVLSIGFEKTYYFMRYAAEMLASPRITALFLLNSAAHDPEVASSLTGLFSNKISFGKRGVEIIKLPEAKVGAVEVEKISTRGGR